MKTRKLLLFVATAALVPTLSSAVTFTIGNNPQPGEENVLLNNGTTGTTVTGTTNQTGLLVNFSSTQTLSEPSSGQARIEATNGTSQIALTDVTFGVANGTFTDAIFNMYIGGTIGTAGGTVDVMVNSNSGVSTFSMSLGNGQNFLTIVAGSGELLNNISIDYATGFTDLRQVRISGATAATVPDSGSTLILLGVTVLALALIRRKRALN